MTTNEFMECDICRKKPGSPKLCDACVHNRDLIQGLKEELRARKLDMTKGGEIKDDTESGYVQEGGENKTKHKVDDKGLPPVNSGTPMPQTNPPRPSVPKPPLGVESEIFYKEQRVRDLASGIDRYIQNGFFGGGHATRIIIWCGELSRRLQEFK